MQCQTHSKQVQRTVTVRCGRGACASFRCADAPRWTAQHAAAQLRRCRIVMGVGIIVFSVATVASAVAQQDVSYVISRHQVGPVTIGSPAQRVYEAAPNHELVDLALEGFLTPALRLTLPGQVQRGGVTAELIARDDELVVYRIIIDDPGLRTEKDIGVGSTVDDLRKIYDLRSLGYGEAGFFVRVDELAASFLLDGGDPSWRDQAKVPGSLKVVRILLTE